jgi:hypothetical protein
VSWLDRELRHHLGVQLRPSDLPPSITLAHDRTCAATGPSLVPAWNATGTVTRPPGEITWPKILSGTTVQPQVLLAPTIRTSWVLRLTSSRPSRTSCCCSNRPKLNEAGLKASRHSSSSWSFL